MTEHICRRPASKAGVGRGWGVTGGAEKPGILWLEALPDEVVRAFAATTGQANVFAVVCCRDTQHMYTYLSEKIGALDGIRAAESALVLRRIKLLAPQPGR